MNIWERDSLVLLDLLDNIHDVFAIDDVFSCNTHDIDLTWVEVGGIDGSTTSRMKSACAGPLARQELNGRFVVQDLPHIAAATKNEEGIEYTAWNLLTRQPFKGIRPKFSFFLFIHYTSRINRTRTNLSLIIGARMYYTHKILQDVSDPLLCVVILKRFIEAMKGYSILFIHERYILSRGASMRDVTRDFNRMALHGKIVRTEIQWRKTVDEAGLGIAKIYRVDDEMVIECRVGRWYHRPSAMGPGYFDRGY